MASIIGEERGKSASSAASSESRWPISTVPVRSSSPGEDQDQRGGRRGPGSRHEKSHPAERGGAYHSRLMEPARAAFAAFSPESRLTGPTSRCSPTRPGGGGRARGDSHRAGEADRFSGAVGGLPARRRRRRRDRVLELGPGAVLAGLARAHRPVLAGAEFRRVGRFRRLKAAEAASHWLFSPAPEPLGRAPLITLHGRIAQTQFLHHRPRRPRQDDAVRPAARVHPSVTQRDEGPDAGLDGSREGACITIKMHPVT